MAVLATLMWGRFFLLLLLTKTFGPTLQMVMVMGTELSIFMALVILEIIMFSSMGSLFFYELPEYSNFVSVFIMLFQAAMGDWDLSIYD